MIYINSAANAAGYYGNPHSVQAPGDLLLPEELLADYLAARGFVYVQHDGLVITAIEVNAAALAAYNSDHADAEPEPEPEGDIWDELAEAIRSGVNGID